MFPIVSIAISRRELQRQGYRYRNFYSERLNAWLIDPPLMSFVPGFMLAYR